MFGRSLILTVGASFTAVRAGVANERRTADSIETTAMYAGAMGIMSPLPGIAGQLSRHYLRDQR